MTPFRQFPGPRRGDFWPNRKFLAVLESWRISAQTINYLGIFANLGRFYGRFSAEHPFYLVISYSKQRNRDCRGFPRSWEMKFWETAQLTKPVRARGVPFRKKYYDVPYCIVAVAKFKILQEGS